MVLPPLILRVFPAHPQIFPASIATSADIGISNLSLVYITVRLDKELQNSLSTLKQCVRVCGGRREGRMCVHACVLGWMHACVRVWGGEGGEFKLRGRLVELCVELPLWLWNFCAGYILHHV